MGLAQLKQANAATSRAFSDIQTTIEEMIAEGERVMARWTQRATHIGEFMGIPPTGKRVSYGGINIFRVVGDRIVEDTLYWDFSVILRQLQEAQ